MKSKPRGIWKPKHKGRRWWQMPYVRGSLLGANSYRLFRPREHSASWRAEALAAG